MAKHNPLKIALVAPLVTPIAPPFLGGAQVMLNDLAQGLARRGHQVTLYASAGSWVEGVKLKTVAMESGELAQADFNQNGAGLSAVFYKQAELFLEIFLDISKNSDSYDIAHAHAFDWPAFALGSLCHVPVVHTVHLPSVDEYITSVIRTAYQKTGTSNCVTVSKKCASTYADQFPFDRVIYNGINLESIPFGEKGEDYLLFAGRMSPEKGPDKAIEIARRAGKKLKMIGGIYDKGFYEREIAPQLVDNPDIEYLGTKGRAEVYELMSRAAGLLFPSTWEEPFGLVLAEAQAAGAPAITFDTGAAREIVLPGETGFILPIGDLEGAAKAVARLEGLERAACRRNIAAKFTIEKMLDEYEEYYYGKLSG